MIPTQRADILACDWGNHLLAFLLLPFPIRISNLGAYAKKKQDIFLKKNKRNNNRRGTTGFLTKFNEDYAVTSTSSHLNSKPLETYPLPLSHFFVPQETGAGSKCSRSKLDSDFLFALIITSLEPAHSAVAQPYSDSRESVLTSPTHRQKTSRWTNSLTSTSE